MPMHLLLLYTYTPYWYKYIILSFLLQGKILIKFALCIVTPQSKNVRKLSLQKMLPRFSEKHFLP